MILIFVLFMLGACSAKKCHDDSVGIERPCPDMEICCVRNFFTKHSKCKPVYTQREDFDYDAAFPLPLPHANVSLSWAKPCIKGLRGEIKDLYLNKETNNLVLVVYYHKVVMNSEEATIKYYRNGKEPIKLRDAISVTYRCVTQTVTIPYDPVDGISWAERDVYTHFGYPDFPFTMGDGLCNTDPEVRCAHAAIKDNFFLNSQEAATLKGPYYFSMYFENNICKF